MNGAEGLKLTMIDLTPTDIKSLCRCYCRICLLVVVTEGQGLIHRFQRAMPDLDTADVNLIEGSIASVAVAYWSNTTNRARTRQGLDELFNWLLQHSRLDQHRIDAVKALVLTDCNNALLVEMTKCYDTYRDGLGYRGLLLTFGRIERRMHELDGKGRPLATSRSMIPMSSSSSMPLPMAASRSPLTLSALNTRRPVAPIASAPPSPIASASSWPIASASSSPIASASSFPIASASSFPTAIQPISGQLLENTREMIHRGQDLFAALMRCMLEENMDYTGSFDINSASRSMVVHCNRLIATGAHTLDAIVNALNVTFANRNISDQSSLQLVIRRVHSQYCATNIATPLLLSPHSMDRRVLDRRLECLCVAVDTPSTTSPLTISRVVPMASSLSLSSTSSLHPPNVADVGDDDEDDGDQRNNGDDGSIGDRRSLCRVGGKKGKSKRSSKSSDC